jgi:hypothetical protein
MFFVSSQRSSFLAKLSVVLVGPFMLSRHDHACNATTYKTIEPPDLVSWGGKCCTKPRANRNRAAVKHRGEAWPAEAAKHAMQARTSYRSLVIEASVFYLSDDDIVVQSQLRHLDYT